MHIKKVSLYIFLLCILGLVVYVFTVYRNPPGKIRNVILISIDSLGAKHLDAYGYPRQTTPNLDRFLGASYVYLNTISPSSWTIPSHMSVFTSMYPSEHKMVNEFSAFDLRTQKAVIANLKNVAPSAVTLAEILRNNGFVTAAFTGDAGLDKQFGFGQGFDTFFDEVSYGGFDTTVPQAFDWLAKHKDKKFFLFLHGYDVNPQYTPAGGYDNRYVDESNVDGKNPQISRSVAVYDEKINRTDLKFKDIMDRLQKSGVMGNTLVIVFSDHGLENYEHGGLGAGMTLYGELTDVLLAIHKPGQTVGKKIGDTVSSLDIFPTVLTLLGIQNPVPGQVKGIDLTPSFNGTPVSRIVFSETDRFLSTHKRSVQTPDGWKFIFTLNSQKKELYNLNTDPQEQNNITGAEPQKTKELEQILEKHLKDMNADKGPWTIGCPPGFTQWCE